MTKVGHGRSPPQNRHTVGSAENRSGIVLATISRGRGQRRMARPAGFEPATTRLEGGCSIQLSYGRAARLVRSEEHTSELQSLMRISYAVFCLKKKKKKTKKLTQIHKYLS